MDKLWPFGPLAHVCLHLYYYIVWVYLWPSNLPYNYHITVVAKVVGKIMILNGWFLFSLLVFYISDFVKEISMLHVVQYYPWFTALFKNARTLKFKSHLYNCIFRCCQSWLRSQATNPDTKKNTPNGLKSTNHKLQTMTFWTHWGKLCLFPIKRSVKIIDGSKKHKHQLPF